MIHDASPEMFRRVRDGTSHRSTRLVRCLICSCALTISSRMSSTAVRCESPTRAWALAWAARASAVARQASAVAPVLDSSRTSQITTPITARNTVKARPTRAIHAGGVKSGPFPCELKLHLSGFSVPRRARSGVGLKSRSGVRASGGGDDTFRGCGRGGMGVRMTERRIVDAEYRVISTAPRHTPKNPRTAVMAIPKF